MLPAEESTERRMKKDSRRKGGRSGVWSRRRYTGAQAEKKRER